ncbi:MAG: hypothetical protein LBE60_05440 [Microbacterium sp.]|jgi:DNA-binding transcriptional regulator YhcF (GntR family)|uniref:hypothetical protein n=1 Tax=Microbacterium sp. TaxID=51671 RepID=UPI00282F1E60|nr:hypothetical protein [Microbacterium sp.]MDR2321073.1 hypothetical protein [Microbacterium sp.]
MKNNEIVWRTIADAAIVERRRWDSIADLAFEAGTHEQTTHLAVKKLREIGAVTKLGRGGFSVTSPDKVITLLSAWRNLTSSRDCARTTVNEVNKLIEQGVRLTGALFDAAVHHLGGVNTIADYSHNAVYVGHDGWVGRTFEPGDEITILFADDRAIEKWAGVASPAQTIADLFATPGWQSAEFRFAMLDKFVPRRDWEQR